MVKPGIVTKMKVTGMVVSRDEAGEAARLGIRVVGWNRTGELEEYPILEEGLGRSLRQHVNRTLTVSGHLVPQQQADPAIQVSRFDL